MKFKDKFKFDVKSLIEVVDITHIFYLNITHRFSLQN